MNGTELLCDEKKVLVKQVYAAESWRNKEFVEGAILRVNKLLLPKMCFKRKERKKKKGRGHKKGVSPQKWTKTVKKLARNSGKAYIFSSNKSVPAK